MNTPKPTPITKWQTSDGRVHDDEDTAERHEVVTRVIKRMPEEFRQNYGNALYAPLMTAAKYFNIVELPQPGSAA